MLPYNYSNPAETFLTPTECDDPKIKNTVSNCGYDLVGDLFRYLMPLINGSNIFNYTNSGDEFLKK